MRRQRRLQNAARIGLSLGTVALLISTLGWEEISAVLREADVRLLAFAWALFLAGIVVRTFRWRALLDGLGLHPPLGRLLYLYLVGGFFNAFLPTGFGGDVVRILELAQGEGRAAAAGTVLVDRLTGILSLMSLGLLVLPFTPDLMPWLVAVVIAICGSGLVAGFLVLDGRLLTWLSARLPGPFSLTGEGAAARIYAAVIGCGPRAIWTALAYSTVFNLINITVSWLCGRAVGIAVGMGFYFVTVPLLSLTLLVPISVGGLGVRDWVAQPLFGSVGIAAVPAAAMSLSAYAVTAGAGLVGGLLYLITGVRGLLERRAGTGEK
ncbi:MAG: flippase-like domain-containing protein [Anaerolineae bacterium]|nr:flippase-like domain-containing protein [Anaerolineae bacterium]